MYWNIYIYKYIYIYILYIYIKFVCLYLKMSNYNFFNKKTFFCLMPVKFLFVQKASCFQINLLVNFAT